ncbi:MAG: VPLPA-CTERM-specific exosortase XrtD [Steroidobacteraceae bacterium]
MTDTMATTPLADNRPVYRIVPLTWLLLAVAMIAAVLAVKTGLSQMLEWLLTKPEYSYGLIIPFIAAFLVWQRRDQIERMPFNGSWAGLVLALFGAAMGAIGKLSTLFTIEHYSVVITLYGLVLALTGWRVFRLLWVPLLILLFMVPLPDILYQNLSAQLQLLSSRIGVWFIRLVGISVYLEGNVIDLGTFKLQVAEACSGLRYLFPLMTIGFLMAYFFKAAFWKRALLFLSSIPITILMNSFRIGTIGVMVDHWGVQMAEGFLHEFQGWVIFMASSAIMVLEMMLLARVGAARRPWRELFGLEFPAPTPKAPPAVVRPVPINLYASVVALGVVAALSLSLPERAESIPPRKSFADYPTTLGPWIGRRETLETVYLNQLMLDDYLLADFVREQEPPINYYIAWYDSQRAGRSVHSPRGCLPGGGWEIQSLTQLELPGVRTGGEPLRVNRVLIRLGNRQQLVYYWFQQRGRVITNEYAAKWYLFWDALTRNRTDGALVRLVVALPPNGAAGAADQQLTQFAAAAAPTLATYVPD